MPTIVMSEMAEKDAAALRRMEELKRLGLWGGLSGRGGATPKFLLPKEPPKTHERDHQTFLLLEMEWLAKDFKRERESKIAQAKRLVKAVAKHVKNIDVKAGRAAREEEAALKRIAATMARCVRTFWTQIGKIVAYKQQQKAEAERSAQITKHLDLVVEQAGKLTESIARDLLHDDEEQAKTVPVATPELPSRSTSKSPHSTAAAATASDESEDDDEDACEDGDAADHDALDSRDKIDAVAQAAQAAQPTGTTLATTLVKTRVPPLLRGTLREYQHVGLDWLATMYEKKLNVILADEMGLGKTVMTIALLAHLACDRQLWGPHLIIVPSSTVMNWELELKKWCPALKVVTYIGTPKERKMRRAGWSKENALHVCITSYRLALQDQSLFRRKRWCYMILDEAQNIKNFKSQRWQTLLQFHSERRLLLTGTPLQNNLLELWSLMHFLMPAVFSSHAEFASWFSVPLTALVEKGDAAADPEVVKRLHAVLRPFLLRRIKRDVEKGLPPKREVIVHCKLSRRQQNLYEEFINAAQTQETLTSGSFFGVVNILMQLRKVCNHPDLFAPRPTESPFEVGSAIRLTVPSLFFVAMPRSSLPSLALVELESSCLAIPRRFAELADSASNALLAAVRREMGTLQPAFTNFLDEFASERARLRRQERWDALLHAANLNKLRSAWCVPVFGGQSLRELVTVQEAQQTVLRLPSLADRIDLWAELAPHYVFLHPKATALTPILEPTHGFASIEAARLCAEAVVLDAVRPLQFLVEPLAIRLQMHFPDKRLLQYDCGKLQELAVLLQRLRDGGHKVVMFTQMAKVLDIIESFANMHRYAYIRLDGATRVDRR
jgi:E1A-binding protein p400